MVRKRKIQKPEKALFNDAEFLALLGAGRSIKYDLCDTDVLKSLRAKLVELFYKCNPKGQYVLHAEIININMILDLRGVAREELDPMQLMKL